MSNTYQSPAPRNKKNVVGTSRLYLVENIKLSYITYHTRLSYFIKYTRPPYLKDLIKLSYLTKHTILPYFIEHIESS